MCVFVVVKAGGQLNGVHIIIIVLRKVDLLIPQVLGWIDGWIERSHPLLFVA